MFLSPTRPCREPPRQREPSDSINSTTHLKSPIQPNLDIRIIKFTLTLASLCRGRWIFPCIYTWKKTEGEFETFLFIIIKGFPFEKPLNHLIIQHQLQLFLQQLFLQQRLQLLPQQQLLWREQLLPLPVPLR